jgi:hypothetical protein
MSKTTMVMVYSAISEAEVSRQYSRGAAEAERSGYVPVSEVWDHNTLTVTYQYRGERVSVDQVMATEAVRAGGGLRSRFRHRLGW